MSRPEIPRTGPVKLGHVPPRPMLPPAPQPAQASARPYLVFDGSRPAPQFEVLRASYDSGYGTGYQRGLKHGWRWGLLSGACSTVALASLVIGIAAGLGWTP